MTDGPGIDGIPFRGPPGTSLKQHEVDGLPTVSDAKVRQIVLSRPDDLETYNRVMDGAAKGRFNVIQNQSVWSEAIGSFVILLHWEEVFFELPNARFSPTDT